MFHLYEVTVQVSYNILENQFNLGGEQWKCSTLLMENDVAKFEFLILYHYLGGNWL